MFPLLLAATGHTIAASTHSHQIDQPMSLDGVQPMNGQAPMQLWLRDVASSGQTVLDAVRARTADEADALGAAALALSTANIMHDQQPGDDSAGSAIRRLRGGAAAQRPSQRFRPLQRVAERLGGRAWAAEDVEFVIDPETLVLVPALDGEATLRLRGGRAGEGSRAQ